MTDKYVCRTCNDSIEVKDISTKLPLPRIISEASAYSYSDHEGVETCFTVEKVHENAEKPDYKPE